MVYKDSLPAWPGKALSIVALLVAVVHARGLAIQNPFNVGLFPQTFVAGTSSLVSWMPTAEGTVSLKLFVGASREMRYVSTVARRPCPFDHAPSLPTTSLLAVCDNAS